MEDLTAAGWTRYSQWKEDRNEEGWKQYEDFINWGMPHRGSGNTKVYKGVICPSPTVQANTLLTEYMMNGVTFSTRHRDQHLIPPIKLYGHD